MPDLLRKPRRRHRIERLYRVVGYETHWSTAVTTWTYKRLQTAEWRAAHIHQLVEFAYADVAWANHGEQPTPPPQIPGQLSLDH